MYLLGPSIFLNFYVENKRKKKITNKEMTAKLGNSLPVYFPFSCTIEHSEKSEYKWIRWQEGRNSICAQRTAEGEREMIVKSNFMNIFCAHPIKTTLFSAPWFHLSVELRWTSAFFSIWFSLGIENVNQVCNCKLLHFRNQFFIPKSQQKKIERKLLQFQTSKR